LFAWIVAARAAEPCAPAFARVVSVQGNVELRRAGANWQAAELNATLCAGDMVRVHQRSRTALLLSNETTLRLDQGTVLSMTAPDRENATLLDLVSGGMHVITRAPKPFRVKTPFVNANVEGTEFAVRVDESKANIVVYEGHVIAENDAGSVALASGETALARRTAAPRKEVVFRPRDAVTWTLYFPTIFDYQYRLGAGTARTPGESARQRSIDLYRSGKLADALAALDNVADTDADSTFLTYRAGLLLVVGRLDDAKPEIERALRHDPNSVDAYSLLAVIAVVDSDKDRALELADKAINLDPGSPTARIARSYALQAQFKIERALADAQQAVELDPQHALAWARLAELQMSNGDLDRALVAAQRAAGLNPDLTKIQTVLGFANLVRVDIQAAKASFENAIALDQADPLPRLGLGLAKIREGALDSGRVEIEISASLDPGNSLIRSYLGKAYFEERRDRLAGQQLAMAQERDPNDPTPYLYDAIRKQTENQPVEALQDLEKSIELNGNRAVYRSQLLLDEDSAARSVSLARIYEDLGFQGMSIVEAVRSLSKDPTNHSAHYFLSDYYLTQPRHEMARDSELLQAQLLQPLNANPAQPRLAGSGFGFLDHSDFRLGANEYSQLLTTQGVRAYADVAAGDRGTYSSSLAASGLTSTIAWSIGQSTFGTDGFRPNNDQRLSVADAYLQYARSPETSVQLELRTLSKNLGDTAVTFFDANNSDASVRNKFKSDSIRLGLRHAWSARSVLLASYVYRDESDHLVVPTVGFESTIAEKIHLLELRGIHLGDHYSTTEGISLLEGRESTDDRLDPDPPTISNSSLGHVNAYVYHTQNVTPSLEITVGLSADAYRDPQVDRNQLNPKLGVLWSSDAGTTLRFAAFRALKRSVAAAQTLEPTNLVGFNQFFSGINDINGTDNRRVGVAVDQKFSPSLWFGSELSERRIRLLSSQIFATEDLVFRESDWSSYLNWTPSLQSSLSLGLEIERLSASSEALSPNLLHDARTTSASAEWRLFGRNGLFSKVRVSRVLQDGQFFDFASAAYAKGKSEGTLVDLGLGYRLPRRWGIVSFELRNALDDVFQFQEINPQNPSFPRRRTAVIRLRLDFF